MAKPHLSTAVQNYILALEKDLRHLLTMSGQQESETLTSARDIAWGEMLEGREYFRMLSRRHYEKKCAKMGKTPRPYTPRKVK